jgi:RNA polymerase sigma-70 factor (ECF subfamily)
VDRYGDDLFRLGCSIMGSEADAHDLVQETLIGVFRRVSAFDGRSSLRTWLLRILFNQASKAKRSRRLRQAIPLHVVDGTARAAVPAPLAGRTPAAPHPGNPPGGGAGAVLSSGRKVDPALRQPSAEPAIDARLDALAMLQTLSEDHRHVLVLREVQRMTYDEIAVVLDVPIGTVESRLYRARREVQKRFPAYFP